MNILVVIPARGGSKGIPRKNLRTLAGKPLIYYSIQTALYSKFKPDVYVSSEDEEILMVARKCGAKTHYRNVDLADDKTTLDPVIYEAYDGIKKQTAKDYNIVITMQPTSPLLKTASLDNALEKFISSDMQTIISAKKEVHLSWKIEKGRYVPNYKERVNRQYLDPFFPETGSFVICRSDFLEKEKRRIGQRVDLAILSEQEAIDIDTYEDWNLCEYLLNCKTILLVVTGYQEIGLGHVYRSLILANSILNHRLIFLVDKKSNLGLAKIREQNYEAYIQEHNDILEDIKGFNPDIVINDILDTTAAYMKTLKDWGMKVINFEDLGEGAQSADLVVNALYPETEVLPNHHFGHLYFCPRDEFIFSEYKTIVPEVKHVLITMGGVDPNNLTLKTLAAITPFCQQNNIGLDVVLGLGYQQKKTLEKFKNINIYHNIKSMSDFMLKADIILTSAGRTVYEAACIGTPTIVLCQNQREMTHFFATANHGFINLGLGSLLSEAVILRTFEKLVLNYEERKYAQQLMLSANVRDGRMRVIHMIQNVIGEAKNEERQASL